MRGLPRLALLFVVGASACGFARDQPDLLESLSFQTTRVASGDTMRLVGRGFPESRDATMIFKGTLQRPGQAPEENVEIETPALHTFRHALDVKLTESLEAEFCGATPVHTTFRGDVIGAFPSLAPGSPPVTGRARGVVLDIHPRPAALRERLAREALGQQFAEYVGMDLVEARGRFRVVGVTPEGRAARAGVEPDDELWELDGVTLQAWSDLYPAGQLPTSELVVLRKGGAPTHHLAIDVSGFSGAAPKRLVPVAFALLLFGLLAFVLRGPLGRAQGLLESHLWLRRSTARAQSGRREESVDEKRRARVARAAPESLVFGTLGYLSVLAVALGFLALSLRQSFVLPGFDLGLFCSGAVLLHVAAALAAGGFEGQGSWSLRRGLLHALQIFLLELPLLSALLSVGLLSGSLDSAAQSSAQGSLPWEWRAFHSPLWLGLLALSVFCLLPRSSTRQTAIPEALDPLGRPGVLSNSVAFVELAERVRLWVSAGVLVTLFLGGSNLPLGVSPESPAASARVAIALGFQLKLVLVVWCVTRLRRALPRIDASDIRGMTLRLVLPASLTGVALSIAFLDARALAALPDIQRLAGPLLFAASVLAASFGALRLLRSAETPRAQPNPWL